MEFLPSRRSKQSKVFDPILVLPPVGFNPRQVRYWPIVLKKSFLTDERKFLGPLMRLVRCDVRGHIVMPKIDHGSRRGATERFSGKEV
jgi:hypothetical protein